MLSKGNRRPQGFQKFLRSLCKCLIFFPDQLHLRRNLHGKRAETKRTVLADVNDIVKTDGVSHAFFHHDGAIEQQVISASNGEIFGIISEDMRQVIVPEHLSGSDEGIGQKILWGDDCFLGKRCIFGHQYAESVHGGKGEKIIAGCVDFPEYQGKVNEP